VVGGPICVVDGLPTMDAAWEQIEKLKISGHEEHTEQDQINAQAKEPPVLAQVVTQGYHWEERIIDKVKQLVILDGKNKFHERYPLDDIKEVEVEIAKLNNPNDEEGPTSMAGD